MYSLFYEVLTAGGHSSSDSGLYRVHQFSKVNLPLLHKSKLLLPLFLLLLLLLKVELFGVTANETGKESDDLLQEILLLQKEICSELGLHYRCVNYLQSVNHNSDYTSFRNSSL